jgi:hypothetical protein
MQGTPMPTEPGSFMCSTYRNPREQGVLQDRQVSEVTTFILKRFRSRLEGGSFFLAVLFLDMLIHRPFVGVPSRGYSVEYYMPARGQWFKDAPKKIRLHFPKRETQADV